MCAGTRAFEKKNRAVNAIVYERSKSRSTPSLFIQSEFSRARGRERHTHPLLRAREQERRRVNGKRHLKSPLRHYHAQFDPFSGGRSRGRIHSCRRCPEIRARVQLFSSFEKGGKKRDREHIIDSRFLRGVLYM